ncbi:MAG: phosphoribosylanthranilate isomerase [Halieaceae bacterium]|nr:phosphoribosylanthranilate isomerase [Halieaceae bacterium]
MRTRVKFCGITRNEDAHAAVAAGADAIGLVFYQPSSRALDVTEATAVLAGLPPFVTVTALFVDAEAAEVEAVCTTLPIDLLQFHGNEPEDYCNSFGKPYIKALRIGGDRSPLEDSLAAWTSARAILLDTWQSGTPGGTGKTFDWSLAPSSSPRPIVLAGGLTLDNVEMALRQVAPYAVDVSGGVEDSPGCKSAAKMRRFVQAVRRADAANEARDHE